MKYSRQRELVREAVLRADNHPTADDVYRQVKQKEPTISLATVYRNLNQLAEHGMIRRIVVPGDSDRFDRTLAEHEHMICTECGGVQDLFARKPMIKAFWELFDAEITSYDLVLYGVCRSCRAKISGENGTQSRYRPLSGS